ncbi:MAG: hypothetical protein E7271_06745 [Lachnospiraceae bacterium]|nr:hypothetical protein [Lachnospiraceae bacterium]
MAEFDGIRAVLWDLINPIEAYIILRFVAFHVGYKDRVWGRKIALATYLIVWDIIVVVNGFVLPDIPIDMFINAVLVLIYGHFYLKGTVSKKLFWYMISVLVVVVSDSIAGVFFFLTLRSSYGFDYLMKNFELRMLFALLGVMILFVITELYFRIRRSKDINYTNKDVSPKMVFAAVMIVFTVMVIVYSFMTVEKSIAGLVRMLAYILIYIVLLYLIGNYLHNIKEKTALKQELELIRESEEKRTVHYEEGDAILTKARELRHDEKHHLIYLEMLNEKENYGEMLCYLKQIKG